MTGHLWLSDKALGELGLSPGEITSAIEDALAEKAGGHLAVAPKSALLPGDGRYMMATLAVGPEVVVVKQVSVCPENPARDLPAINGAIMVLDAQTGLLRAIMDANWITGVRTAALSDVAAARLADPRSETIGFVGAGVQARSHLAAFAARFPLKRARIFGRGQANIARLTGAAEALGLSAEVVEEGNAALDTSDIVVTSVTLNYDTEPFLDAGRLKSEAFAAITDLAIPWRDETMTGFHTIVVDDLEQERAAETPMVAPESIAGDLADLVAGRITPRDGARAFVFRGMALGDYAAAKLALARADDSGRGQRIGG